MKFHPKYVKKSSKNTFFVKTTYSQCDGNQSGFFLDPAWNFGFFETLGQPFGAKLEVSVSNPPTDNKPFFSFWLWDLNFILEKSPNHKTLILSLPSCFGTLCTSLLFFYQSDAAKNNIRVSKYFCRPQNLGRSTLVQIFLFIQKLLL